MFILTALLESYFKSSINFTFAVNPQMIFVLGHHVWLFGSDSSRCFQSGGKLLINPFLEDSWQNQNGMELGMGVSGQSGLHQSRLSRMQDALPQLLSLPFSGQLRRHVVEQRLLCSNLTRSI